MNERSLSRSVCGLQAFCVNGSSSTGLPRPKGLAKTELVTASEAWQSSILKGKLDCFALLAMTNL